MDVSRAPRRRGEEQLGTGAALSALYQGVKSAHYVASTTLVQTGTLGKSSGEGCNWYHPSFW